MTDRGVPGPPSRSRPPLAIVPVLVDGQTWNPVDPERAAVFMAEVKRVRCA